jgi:rhodanese-related sulfurtransferase
LLKNICIPKEDQMKKSNLTYLMLTLLFVLSVGIIGCQAQPAPVAPQPQPQVPTAVSLPVAPTFAPKPAFDMKATLDIYFTNLPDGFGTIAPAALNDQLAVAKPFVVDIREAKEISDNGYIAGAVNIPIRTLLKNLDKLPAKDQAIVVMCGSGHRSALGMEALQLLGYTNVKSLAGGFSAWKAANLPVATGTLAEAMAGKVPDVDKDLLAALDKYFGALPDGFGTIAPAALNDQLAVAKPFQVDAREAKEISDNGMIAGSVNIPVRTLIKNLDKLPQDKNAAIIAECGSGHRSAMTMMALNLLGYANVKSLAGGFGAWKSANLPVAK